MDFWLKFKNLYKNHFEVIDGTYQGEINQTIVPNWVERFYSVDAAYQDTSIKGKLNAKYRISTEN